VVSRTRRTRSLVFFALSVLALTFSAALAAPAALAANGASITGGSVPAQLAPGATAQVSVTVSNTGTTTWPAQSAFRLATSPANNNGVEFAAYQCGGYMNNVLDGRIYTCATVAPGQAHTYVFTIRMPAGATGSRLLSLQMVQEGVAFFGSGRSWSISTAVPALPDIVVDSVTASPASPTAGAAVTFSAVVRNAGAAATPAGVVIGVGYLVNGAQVTFGTVSGPLAAGASVTVGTTSSAWTAIAGNHTVTAVADDLNRFAESNETNNSRAISLAVGGSAAGNLYGMNIDPANPGGRPSAAQAKAAGARWLRIEWKHYAGGYGFYDPIIADYRAAGLKVMLIVDYTSPTAAKPASNASDAAWNTYRNAWNATLTDLAAHYGNNVDAWQIWNEQDLHLPGTGYDPGVPAHQYGFMLRDAQPIIRARSSRPIVTGGLASGNAGYLTTVRANAGGVLPVDYVAVHPYGQRAPDNWPNAGWGFGNMSDLFDRYLAYGKPLWVSEIGVDTTDTAFQANYLQNVYQLASSARFAGRVTAVFWFCWSDAMVGNFGVLFGNGSAKPSYSRYQSLAGPW
jgi:CARDB/Glycosyl hydrolase catalytic core